VLDSWGLSLTTISVFENGTSALQSANEDVEIFVPESAEAVTGGTASAQEVYQAYEVWRRLCGAAAGGASILGWHSLQSSRNDEGLFFGHGLRKDSSDTVAKTAEPRLSYFMYQVFASMFRSYSACTMVLPEVIPVNRTSPEAESYRDSVVFEFYNVISASGSWDQYIYVCILDRWRDTSEGTPRCESVSGEPVAMTFSVTGASSDTSFPDGVSDIDSDGHFVTVAEVPAMIVSLVPNIGDVAVVRASARLKWST
jgi:hypothetical protein